MKQQIEEMARTLCGEKEKTCQECGSCDLCEFWIESSTLYNAGYRKQIEGEWVIKKGGYYQRLVCSVCEKLSIATFEYCPNCGAHMKGGAE